MLSLAVHLVYHGLAEDSRTWMQTHQTGLPRRHAHGGHRPYAGSTNLVLLNSAYEVP